MVDVNVIVDEARGVISAEAFYNGANRPYYGVGSARLNEEDKYDETIGLKLAVGRAIKDLGREIEREGWAEVRSRDEERQAQKEANEKRKAQAEGRATWRGLGLRRQIIESK